MTPTLNKDDYIEDHDVYYYFRDKIFLKELDEFIEKNYSKRKGKLIKYEDYDQAALEDIEKFRYASEGAKKVHLAFMNMDIRKKYFFDFHKQRQG